MKPLKILHLIDGLDVAGTELAMYNVLSRMDRQRFANTVVVFMDSGPVGSLLRDASIPVLPLNMKRGSPSVTSVFRLVRAVHRERPAILQSWGYAANCVSAVLGPMLGIRNVVWNIRRARLLRGDCSRLTALASACCGVLSRVPRVTLSCTAVGLADHRAMGYRPRRSLVIPNGFDTDRFRPALADRVSSRREWGVTCERPVIGMFGRFHPDKDHGTFLAAAALFSRIRPDVHYVLCGSGVTPDNPALSTQLRGHPSPGQVHLLGERRDVPRILNGLDLLALPSLTEGFPNVVGEAMATGVPCVVSRSAGDSPAIVGNTGAIVEPGNPAALADAWDRMLSADGSRARLGQMARARIQQHYGMPRIVRAYEEFYTALAAGQLDSGGSVGSLTSLPADRTLALTADK